MPEYKDDEIIKKRGALRVYLPLKEVIVNNFLGGIAWGLGTVLGATVLVALIVLLFNVLGGIPYAGGMIRDIIETVQEADQLP